MTTNCKKCGWQVVKIDLSEEIALEIRGLLIQDAKLFAMKKLKDEFKIDLRDAKGFVIHFNTEFGKCNNCNYYALDEEYITCPKCKSFNYNLKMEPPSV